MSVELDWDGLEQTFADSLCERLNCVLESMTMPSFLGPTRVHSLELGSDVPDVQVIGMSDVWREFRVAEAQAQAHGHEKVQSATPPRMPPRLRTFRHYDEDDMPQSVHHGSEASMTEHAWSDIDDTSSSLYRWSDTESDVGTIDSFADEHAKVNDAPSLQMHLSVHWLTSTIRLRITTSLQIAYQDDTVMSLPISLVITGLEMYAQVIIAMDGVQQCVHISVSEDATDACQPDGLRDVHDARIRTRHQGQRILPYIAAESRIGESAKHVLENVGKVERFVTDLVRQWLEDELVYPHFYTLYL